MSIEIHVLFRGKLPNKTTLSRAMTDLGFPFTIRAGSLERQRGFMAMRLRGEESGVEFDVWNDQAAVQEIAGEHFQPGFERSANFRWGGAEDEMLAANCAAAALARLVNGIVITEYEEKPLSPDEAIALARKELTSVLKPEATKRRGTRPADIRHYLKPLLKQRSDLVLIGRMLVIRPIRHILRGVFFDRTSDKYRFKIRPYLKLLGGPYFDGFDFVRGACEVWQPHFEPLLMDLLQQEIFAPFGTITTLEELAAAWPDDGHDGHNESMRVMALVLAGARERAESYVREVESSKDPDNTHWRNWARSQRDLLGRDLQEMCRECHAAEAEAVKELKLERVWEPSPFPVEVSAAERGSRTAEPLFVTKPWAAPPPDLLSDLPRVAGEVKFAKDWILRGIDWTLRGRNDPVLVAALTRGQAEERYRNSEDYVLAARLAGGSLLLIRWNGTDRLDPSRVDHPNPDSGVYAGGFHLWWSGSDLVAKVMSFPNRDDGMIEPGWVKIDERATWQRVWACYLDWDKSELTVVDHRGGETTETRILTSDEIAKYRISRPAFGQFDALVRTLQALLRSAGYGELA